MNYLEHLTEQDAKALMDLLAETFKVKAPALKFNARNRRGYYYPRQLARWAKQEGLAA